MKHVVEYKLHGGTIPYFIQDGGYFSNNGKLIGLTKDNTDCYIPPSPELVTFATKSDFAVYIIALTLFQRVNQTSVELTEEQKTTLANNWWDSRH